MSDAALTIAERATQLLAAADSEPLAALADATELATFAHEAGVVGGEAMALRAVGLAARNVGEIERSASALRRGIDLAESMGDVGLAAQIRTTFGPTLLYLGRTDDALAELAVAEQVLDGVDRAKVQMQLGGIMARMARFPEAVDLLEAAALTFEKVENEEWLAHAYSNLGLVHAYSGDTALAGRRIRRARELYERIGHDLSIADMTHNLGWVAMREGRIGESLRLYQEAEEQSAELDRDLGELLNDHCEALMLAGLYDDAMAIAQRTADQLAASGMEVGLAEARLMLSHAAFLAGRLDVARDAAVAASAAFASQGRTGWAAHADFGLLRADYALGNEVDGTDAVELADRLALARQHLASLAARVIAARIALDRDDIGLARTQLAIAADARRSRRVDLRLNAWTAEAMLRVADGNRRGALSAVRAGMRSLEDFGATLGSTDARLGVQSLGDELMELALTMNLAGPPAAASEWIERVALRNLDFRPVVPNPVPEVEAALTQLRDVSAQLRGSMLDAKSVASLQAEVNRQVAAIRRSRLGADELGDANDVIRRARHLIGEATLVQWTTIGGTAQAVATTERRRWSVACGPADAIADRLHWLRFHLTRLALHGDSQREAIVDGIRATARELDALLFDRLRLPDEPVILVPPRNLLGVPWGLLPTTSDRAVNAVPSVRSWVRAKLSRTRRRTSLVVAGPRLPGAHQEMERIVGVLDGAVAIDGSDATAERVRNEMEGVGLAHLIAHGAVAQGNPMLSSLELADGPLMLYDLEVLTRPPHTVVLSACESGRVATEGLAGVGIATALLGLGAASVVASTGLIPDTPATSEFLAGFHAALAQQPAAQALQDAFQTLDDGVEGILLKEFVVFGAG